MPETAKKDAKLQNKLDELKGPEWDSSDEESVAEQKIVAGGGKDKKVKKSVRDAANKRTIADEQNAVSSVLYVGHLPPQFEEHELVMFLKQFGKVLNLRVSRSKKTGNSKGYAFVQMHSPAVADIVAETLAGYILFGQRRLVCHVVPAEKVHKKMFFKVKRQLKEKPVQEKPLGKLKKITSRLVQRERKKRQTLKDMGIDYEFPGYEAGEKAKEEKTTAKKEKAPAAPKAKKEKAAPKAKVAPKKGKATATKAKVTPKKAKITTPKKEKEVPASTDSKKSKKTASVEKKTSKRKDSIGSVDSAGSKKSRRKSSDASLPKETKKKAAKPAVAQSERKAAKPTRTSPRKRRTSS